jgi:hypothetical protein
MSAHTPTPATEAVTSEAAPLGGLQDISTRMSDVMMASHDAGNLAALLETLSGTGYSNASAANDEWQMKWSEQAEYLGGVLERLSVELHDNAAAIESALHDIQRGGAHHDRDTPEHGGRRSGDCRPTLSFPTSSNCQSWGDPAISDLGM